MTLYFGHKPQRVEGANYNFIVMTPVIVDVNLHIAIVATVCLLIPCSQWAVLPHHIVNQFMCVSLFKKKMFLAGDLFKGVLSSMLNTDRKV